MIFESKVVVAFDASGVKGAVVSKGPFAARVTGRAEAALPSGAIVPSVLDDNVKRPDVVRDALRRVYAQLGGNGRRASLVLPEGIARLALLEVPQGVAPIEFARFRLVQGLPFAAGEALVDGVPVGGSRVLAAAVRRNVVRGYETIASEAGFTQESVDLLPLVALAPRLRGGERGDALVVVLGDRAASLAYFRGGNLVAFRNRLRDPGPEEFARLRDEIARTVLLASAGIPMEPSVHALGQDADALVAVLRSFGVTAVSGWGDSSEPAASAWLARALA